MDSNSQSPGICQRLINCILSMLRRTQGSTEVPIEEGSSRNGFVDSEIVVEFRHTDGSERWTQTNERGESIRAPKKNGLILSNDQTILQNGLDKRERNKDHFASKVDQGKGLQEMEALSGRDARGKRPKKSVTIKESEGKKEANHSADDQANKVNNQPHEDTKPMPLRPHWPLLSVDSNINEKSDAYIESRKREMGRNYSLDTEKS